MKRIVTLLLILVGFVGGLRAQTAYGTADISSLEIHRIGERAEVLFRIVAPARIVKSNYTMALLPVITDGTYRVSLPAILIQGRRAEKLQARYEWISGREIDCSRAITVRPGSSSAYRASVKTQPWMDGATLMLENRVWGCCGSEVGESETLAQNILPSEEKWIDVVEFPVVPPLSTGDSLAQNYRFLVPDSLYDPDEPIYDEDREKALIIYYRLNNSKIEPEFSTNDQTLANLVAAVNAIAGSPDSEVSRIVVAGFASPEGSYLHNDRLAWDRAVSVKQYIERNTTVRDKVEITLYNGSEDWRGLRVMVEASTLADKEQILRIIDTVPAIDGTGKPRLQQLRQLNGGASYRYLSEHVFPRLRNGAFIRIYYRNN